jgi:CheY-like chemotaxis protein
VTEEKRPIILLVDDELHFKELLYRIHIEVAVPESRIMTAHTASEAISIIDEHKPDLLILDVTLPMSEFDAHVPLGKEYVHSARVAETMRKTCPDAPIIVVSTYVDQHLSHFPKGVVGINTLDMHEQLPVVLDGILSDGRLARNNVVPAAAAEAEPQPAKPVIDEALIRQQLPERHVSRIMQIRRSSEHTGSREGCEDSWAINTQKKSAYEGNKRG